MTAARRSLRLPRRIAARELYFSSPRLLGHGPRRCRNHPKRSRNRPTQHGPKGSGTISAKRRAGRRSSWVGPRRAMKSFSAGCWPACHARRRSSAPRWRGPWPTTCSLPSRGSPARPADRGAPAPSAHVRLSVTTDRGGRQQTRRWDLAVDPREEDFLVGRLWARENPTAPVAAGREHYCGRRRAPRRCPLPRMESADAAHRPAGSGE